MVRLEMASGFLISGQGRRSRSLVLVAEVFSGKKAAEAGMASLEGKKEKHINRRWILRKSLFYLES